MEDLDLLASMAIVLGVALFAGLLANRLKLPVILGYLVSGVVIGPHVLGLIGDVDDVETLATIGVVLLMFTLGLEFSLATLRKIGMIAVFGGIAQVLVTIALGLGIAWCLDFPVKESVLFGFFIALSSTIIVIKTLMDRGELGSPHGRIMIGILLIQDLSVVPMIAVLPQLGDSGTALLQDLGWALGKAAVFLGVVLVLGFWGLRLFMKRVVGERSRELFLLTVVCICLGAGFASHYLGLSVALGAFLAGLLISESEYSQQALADIRPLRDVFAVLFFVALGMLADPGFVADNPGKVAGTVVAVVMGKFVIVALITWAFGYKTKTNLFVGGGLFQIGEFSFILAALALEENLISGDLYDLTLTTAFITILLTPLAMGLISNIYYRVTQTEKVPDVLADEIDPLATEEGKSLTNHVVICGHGRVAKHLGRVLENRGFTYIVIDIDPRIIDGARKKNVPCIFGDASNPEVLAQARLEKARVLVVAFPDPIAVKLVVKNALKVNPRLDVVAMVHGDENIDFLKDVGVAEVVRPELEAGLEIIRHTLHRFGLTHQETQFIVNKLREKG
ncbi:MAG: sodium:proton exchanger [Chloroflexi bacterium]|jgi:monovalent cation:H+ antiporter-2, CPA2 family|nr:sodium:proton exchanger [Chloroflexota bacterium]